MCVFGVFVENKLTHVCTGSPACWGPWGDRNTWNDSYDNERKKKRVISHVLPDELLADGAESRLREERGAELVTFDVVNFGLFDGAAPLVEREQTVSPPLRLQVSLCLTSCVWNASRDLYFIRTSQICDDYNFKLTFQVLTFCCRVRDVSYLHQHLFVSLQPQKSPTQKLKGTFL